MRLVLSTHSKRRAIERGIENPDDVYLLLRKHFKDIRYSPYARSFYVIAPTHTIIFTNSTIVTVHTRDDKVKNRFMYVNTLEFDKVAKQRLKRYFIDGDDLDLNTYRRFKKLNIKIN